jgi:hypothetical protein
MRRSTLIMFLLAIGMVVIYYYLSHRQQPADIAITPEATQEISYLFKAEDGQPTAIREEAKDGGAVELALNADKAWTIVKPFKASADQGASEAAASQITTIRITNSLPNIEPKDVGLDVPQYKLVVKFSSGVERIAEIGVLTPTESGYYARKDDQIVIVDRSGIDALIGLLTNPPYAQTLTPSPIPATATETPLPSSTPEPGVPSGETPTPTP